MISLRATHKYFNLADTKDKEPITSESACLSTSKFPVLSTQGIAPGPNYYACTQNLKPNRLNMIMGIITSC